MKVGLFPINDDLWIDMGKLNQYKNNLDNF